MKNSRSSSGPCVFAGARSRRHPLLRRMPARVPGWWRGQGAPPSTMSLHVAQLASAPRAQALGNKVAETALTSCRLQVGDARDWQPCCQSPNLVSCVRVGSNVKNGPPPEGWVWWQWPRPISRGTHEASQRSAQSASRICYSIRLVLCARVTVATFGHVSVMIEHKMGIARKHRALKHHWKNMVFRGPAACHICHMQYM